MRKFRVIALTAIVVALALLLPEPTVPWQRKPQERPTARRHIIARVVGEAYAPRRFVRGFDLDINDSPAPPLMEDPHDRGRALLRRGEVSKAIPELREAARNGDPAALTDLAAALLGEADLLPWRHPREHGSSRLDPSLRYGSALEAIAVLQRAIEQQRGLAAAHFNLALALEQIGLTVEVRTQFEEAIRLSDDVEWDDDARQHAGSLPLSDPWIDRDRIRAYVEVTSLPAARRLLQPYLAAQEQRLRRGRVPVYPDDRFFLAADTFTRDVRSIGGHLTQAMETFCAGATAEPCATRYYTSGALYAAGRKSEAAAWLHSIEAEVQRAHGGAGLRALQQWEIGLNLYVRGRWMSALEVFDAQYREHRASGERVLAAVFDELRGAVRVYPMSQALSARDLETAFRYADDSSLRDVQSALAPDAAILRYATTVIDHTVVFVIRRDSVDVVTLYDTINRHRDDKVGFVPHGDSVDVVSMDGRLHGARRGGAEITGTAARMRTAPDPATASLLHDLVVAPVLEKLHGISTIAVIPNVELAGIPFGALFDAGRGQYLAERFTIVHAPSARVAVELSRRTRDFHDSTLLAIGATEFDRTQGELLAGVDREVAEITAQSLCARVLSGEQATPDAVQRALTENAVIHYGGHIVGRGADLRLLLASSGGRDSLSAEEIGALRLNKARIVVLAGCRGAASGDPHAFIRTVADAFLIAGVPTVIATSYDLDDAEAPATMRLLHTFLRNGDDAAEALRKTTLIELRTARGMPLSIRFQAIGGASGLIK
jgi:tetratricopeptide (TPR) repeat protein